MENLVRYLTILTAIINIGLLSALLRIYVNNYKKVKSQITIGLVFFASLVLVQHILFAIFFIIITEFHTPSRPLFAFLILNIIMGSAYSILLKVTWN